MTRRDLEETIINLEYLLASNGHDGIRTEQYAQQLQAFRVVLQAANEQQRLLSSSRKRIKSDTKVALMYAEEELFLMLQALMSRERLGAAHQHLRNVLQNQESLPGAIAKCLQSLDATCARRAVTGATDAAGADALNTATMAVLDTVRDELGQRLSTLHP